MEDIGVVLVSVLLLLTGVQHRMPLLDYQCPDCDTINEVLLIGESRKNPKIIKCKGCNTLIDLALGKLLPGSPSFKIKGMRAANGYGLKFQDTYGKSKTDGHESGYSFTSNKGVVVDHNQGQGRKC